MFDPGLSGEGANALVHINGRAQDLYGWACQQVTLTRNGQPGERFDLLLEVAGPTEQPDEPGDGPVR